MNSISQKSSSAAGSGFFYRNLHIQEVLSTIRYGIEARKGLIILTGEAGTGKTVVLQKVAAELPANVTSVLESDPRLSFAEVLRLILRNLNCESSEEDEPALLRNCKLQLRSRAERSQIVALILDNAHHLPDQTLRYITQNFTCATAEDPNGTMLQVVLSGRPGLTSKLSQAALVPLRRRRPIICQVHPLSNREIAAFIQQGLESNNYPVELFDERAIKRVALYARGNPRSVNALCDRAIQLAGATGNVTPELIEGAAGDLDLHVSEMRDNRSNRENATTAEKHDQSAEFQFYPEDLPDAEPTFPEPYAADAYNGGSPYRKAAWPRNIMIVAVLVAGFAIMIRSEVASTVSSEWTGRLKQLATQLHAPAPAINAKSETSVETIIKEEPPIRVPGPDFPAQFDHSKDTAPAKLSNDSDARASVEKALPEPIQTAPQRDQTGNRDRTGNKERRESLKARSDRESQNLQSQVTKAIESRAIMGVEVSILHGTAYLHGRVATERQRRAAERAARGVTGVERVQNRIAITHG
jgi:general secretion pathway protein A